jgi:acyl-[acyl-carrier-protein]-phospholipid O-acyltransferase/long-chain-fatty-acid--[acyl-carrier-protein] ligase
LFVIFTNTLYRLRIVGQQHIPQSGGRFCPDHMSFIDGF